MSLINNNHIKLSTYNDRIKYINDLFDRTLKKSNDYIDLKDINFKLRNDDIKLIAYYLPQFHEIPENNEWWGKGFTEWTNVSNAIPQFIGHYQPHLPGELGFYDLRLKEVMQRQIELAKMYGVYGFCFHHYWFNGKRLLEKPVNMFLNNKDLNIPFCLCWANENWSRRWDGLENDILISQNHSDKDDINFIQDLDKYFQDDRYIKIDGKPLLIIYRIELFPNPKETVERWRNWSINNGYKGIYIMGTTSFGFNDPSRYNLDAIVEYPPHQMNGLKNINNKINLFNPKSKLQVYDYKDWVERKLYNDKENYIYDYYKTIIPSWDNTARNPINGSVFYNSTPNLYKQWLKDIIISTKNINSLNKQYVFINAWNEWGEGAHLEPDRKYGYSYLNATRDAIIETR